MLKKYDLRLLYQFGIFLSIICAVIVLSAKAVGFISWLFPIIGPLFGFIAVVLMLFLAFVMSATALVLLIKSSSGIERKYNTLFIVFNLFITLTGVALIVCIFLSPYIKVCDEFATLVLNLFLSAPDGMKLL